MMALILITGFVFVTILSLFIERKIRHYWSAVAAAYSHIFVLILALYYLIDLLMDGFADRVQFSVFWAVVLLSQLALFFRAIKGGERLT